MSDTLVLLLSFVGFVVVAFGLIFWVASKMPQDGGP